MRGIYDFIVTPKNGDKYDNDRGSGFVLNTSIENHKFVQRVAVVQSTPSGYSGDIKKGDEVVVHHNIFRRGYDMQGRMKESSFHLTGQHYLVPPDLLYMYRKTSDDKWVANEGFVFVFPEANTDDTKNRSRNPNTGIVAYSSLPEVEAGDRVWFEDWCEHEFSIEGEVMYKIKIQNLVWHQKTENQS